MRELERDSPDTAASAAGGTVPPLAIVGSGRAGNPIAATGKRAGLRVELAGRAEALAACRRAEVALLCVPDGAIAGACEVLALAVPPLRFLGHLSGATSLGALAPARERGAEVFSLHPLQTIPDAGTDLAGAPCAVSGSSAEAERLAESLAESLGMRPFRVPEEARAAYHAAASIASNLLVALEESAAALLDKAGIQRATDGERWREGAPAATGGKGGNDYASSRELLAPLVLRTAANWAERGREALTGPIARGDSETVARHRTALRETAPELIPLYEALAERARSLTSRAVKA